MKDFAPKFISVILHPLLIPTYALIYFFRLPTYISLFSGEIQRAIFFIVLMLTFTAPLLTVLIYVNIKQISNLQLHSRRDRIFPLAVTAGFYTINYLIVSRMHDIVPVIIDRFYLTAAVGVFLTLLINFKTKISAHTLAFGGFIGYSCNFDRLMNIAGLLPILIFIGLASIIATSRLKLQAHTPFEVYLGILVGLAVGFSSGFLF